MNTRTCDFRISDVRAGERHYDPRDRRSYREYMSNTRVYVWPKGETILENLANRHTRPYNEFRKLLTTILTNAGFSCLDAAGAHWSQKAGCACGCSPGFVLSKRLTTKEGRSVDIHADIVEAPKS